MESKSMMQLIASQSFFIGLDREYLELFAGCAANQRFKEGQHLLREGKECSHFFIIRQGKVAIEVYAGNKGTIRIQTLGLGDLVGWSWLIAPYRSEFDAAALEPVSVIRFDGNCLREKCRRDYKFGYEMLMRITAVIISRLQATRIQLIDIYQ